jgi:hypothetical protein
VALSMVPGGQKPQGLAVQTRSATIGFVAVTQKRPLVSLMCRPLG